MSSNNKSYDEFIIPMNKTTKTPPTTKTLEELQRQAYQNVLHAFNEESRSLSSKRVFIMQELIQELNITLATHAMIEAKFKTDESRQDIPQDIATSSTHDFTSSTPESLIGKWIGIKMPGEVDYVGFFINSYDPNTEMHHLVTVQNQMKPEDPCDWVDLREIPEEDVMWQEGSLGFPTQKKGGLKPGETILSETSTAQRIKRAKEAAMSGKKDKGKGKAT
ncbi:unnamed protein product [Cochlearia groenlandica]